MVNNYCNGITNNKTVVVVDKKCDNNNKQMINFKLIIISIILLICALLFNFYFNNCNNNNGKIDKNNKNDKIEHQQQQQHIITHYPQQQQHDYDPDAMIKFIDQILNSTLDDFNTIENTTVNLTEISKFNNNHFAPRILSLVKLDPFKFVKFNLKRPCLLWPDTFSCTKIGCNIKFCDRSQLPKEYLILDENCPTNSPKELSKLDQTLRETNVNELNQLFECSRDDSEQSQYFDLILNPERFTGYDGMQIWKAIYEENCFSFNKQQSPSNNDLLTFMNANFACNEQKFFYRLISGLHTSITTHLTSLHHKFDNHFGPNPKDYFKRFYGRDDYLKNLFLTYLIELRALYRIQPYLLDKIQWNLIDDQVQAKEAINALLSTEKLFRWHFDDKLLFERQPILKQLGHVFNNITFNIMDCVSCDKCRLWGKVQTNGLGTAFKILLTKDLDKLRLSHHEITCLLNAASRLSFSVTQISNFRQIFERELITGGGGGNSNKLMTQFIR